MDVRRGERQHIQAENEAQKGPTRESRRKRQTKQVDYCDVEIVTSDSDSEGTIVNSESGNKSEQGVFYPSQLSVDHSSKFTGPKSCWTHPL